jgi:hypothetical protein
VRADQRSDPRLGIASGSGGQGSSGAADRQSGSSSTSSLNEQGTVALPTRRVPVSSSPSPRGFAPSESEKTAKSE